MWDRCGMKVLLMSSEILSSRKGAGVGIRFDLMGMQARLEWGYGFDREFEGGRGKIHFTIGPGF